MVIRSAATRMHQLLAEGVPRRYFSLEEASPTIRGRLDLGKLARRLPSEAHIFPIRHAPLQRDHDLSRLLSVLAQTLSLETSRPESRRVLSECLKSIGSEWQGVLTAAFVENVVLLPQEVQWQPFVELAHALASGSAPHPVEAGVMSGHGLLFPMNDLFERLLRRRFRSLAGFVDLSLVKGNYEHLLREVSTGRALLQLRPDYVFRDTSNRISLVADAKWKVLVTDRQSLHVSREDVYQMSAYLLRHRCHSGLLLYPGEQGVERSTSFQILPEGGRLHVATVDVGGLVSSHESSRSKAEAWLVEVLRAATDEMNGNRVGS
jgi:5-methylcytosine-specific restriction endonuclease McrBC regulatory subunit McrC